MPDGVFEGKPAIRERLAQELAAVPDVTHTVVSFVDQGDAFCDEWTFEGTHTGGPLTLPNGEQLPATGKRVAVKGMEIVRVDEEGKITLNTLYYDNLAVAMQLGLLEPATI
jgi:predicted ester cyclase